MGGIATLEYRELLDGDGDVVGYIDPDGFAHEFDFAPGDPDIYLFTRIEEFDKERVAGENILLPESMTFMLE